ncbi:MAG: DNA-processing protein DprA [bacterium]|nr:DNA-processing protein DprA [bacterium]
MNQDNKYWLGFSYIKGLGASKINHISKYFRSMQDAWQANFEDFKKIRFNYKDIQNIISQRDDINPIDLELNLEKINIKYITLADDNYPVLLKEIFSPPPVLYYKGVIPENNHLALAVVGTRRTSVYGRHVTPQLIKPVVENGVIIVSGLALGIDTVAHQSCLDAGGHTIAVLGCGLDRIYPSTNYKLAEKIIATGGCLISEYPPGTEPFKQHFPARNRIIAGLSKATLIIEGDHKSGAMITAKFALEYNRDVLAIPGNITNTSAQGTNHLIKKGAYLIDDFKDILELYHLPNDKKKDNRMIDTTLTDDEKLLLKTLAVEPLYIDEIIQACKLNTSTANATLVLLEMKGYVKNLGDDKYVRT